MKNNAIFVHAAILDKCKERVLQYLDIIKKSNLCYNVDRIFICFVGNSQFPLSESDVLQYSSNISFIKVSENLQDYELPTLQFIYDFCVAHPNNNILYLHSKNVGKEINYCIEDQIEYMLYFLVKKWETCLEKLIDHDACGVDLRTDPTLHYSGNFWWSTSHNICSLPSPTEFNNLNKYTNPLNSIRHNQEFWICYNKKKYYSLWDCGISVYERHIHRYPKEVYTTN